MNRLLRPFGLKLGPLQAGAVYFPLHFIAVGIGLKLLIAPQGVGVFWPATGSLLAFLLLYPVRYWPALLGFGFVAELAANELFAPQIPYSVAGMLFFVKFAAGVLGAWLVNAGVRGPISFARLRHVLVFAAAALVSTLACAFVAVSLRAEAALQRPRLLALGSELVDRRLPRRAGGDAAAAHYRHPRHHALEQRTRRPRRHVLGLRGVGCCCWRWYSCAPTGATTSPLDVPYIVYPVLVWIAMISGPRRTALAAGITVAVASLATTRASVHSTVPISCRPSSRCACCRCCCCRR